MSRFKRFSFTFLAAGAWCAPRQQLLRRLVEEPPEAMVHVVLVRRPGLAAISSPKDEHDPITNISVIKCSIYTIKQYNITYMILYYTILLVLLSYDIIRYIILDIIIQYCSSIREVDRDMWPANRHLASSCKSCLDVFGGHVSHDLRHFVLQERRKHRAQDSLRAARKRLESGLKAALKEL